MNSKTNTAAKENKMSNAEIASNESLWDEYYNTSALMPFGDYTHEERLASLNEDYPE